MCVAGHKIVTWTEIFNLPFIATFSIPMMFSWLTFCLVLSATLSHCSFHSTPNKTILLSILQLITGQLLSTQEVVGKLNCVKLKEYLGNIHSCSIANITRYTKTVGKCTTNWQEWNKNECYRHIKIENNSFWLWRSDQITKTKDSRGQAEGKVGEDIQMARSLQTIAWALLCPLLIWKGPLPYTALIIQQKVLVWARSEHLGTLEAETRWHRIHLGWTSY